MFINTDPRGAGGLLSCADIATLLKSTLPRRDITEKDEENFSQAPGGEEAIAIYRQAMTDKPVDLVIMDLTIPGGVGGREAATQLFAIDPEAKVIVCRGYANDPVVANYTDHGFKGVVSKPYSIKEFIGEIQRVMGG